MRGLLGKGWNDVLKPQRRVETIEAELPNKNFKHRTLPLSKLRKGKTEIVKSDKCLHILSYSFLISCDATLSSL